MSLPVRKDLPRLPLKGSFDLTYRCNNTCRHCWLWLPPRAPERRQELTFEEIRRIVDEARQMGCQSWAISGGEPMLRDDFAEIFDYITRKAVLYSLNTNGTLITPEIARLLTRKGRKLVALYGATAEVHDRVTRNPGSFEATMRGFAYLKEAGAGFEVQIIPMRSNYHQYGEMLALAESLSPHYRIGAAWLFLSACGSQRRNAEIAGQRLDPADALALDEPDPAAGLLDPPPGDGALAADLPGCTPTSDDRLFAGCIAKRREFHLDPYGWMTFCYFIKHPDLRYDLRQGSFRQAWDEFIPALAEQVRGGPEYMEGCAACDLRRDCRWCAVFGYLEHGRFSAKVEYLCRLAAEARRYKEDWKLDHLRYYQIAGITIQVAADFPITGSTFAPTIEQFRVARPGDDNISLRLVSSVPPRSEIHLGPEIYRYPPWAVYRQGEAWVYLALPPDGDDTHPLALSIFNADHSQGTLFHDAAYFAQGELPALTTFVSDQALIARVLADRQGCYLHAAGIRIDGQGLLFVGHSEAGKSTMLKMLRGQGEILCDDRIILRRWPDGYRIHGTWSHGELPDVSPAEAPLRAILLLEKATENELIPVANLQEKLGVVLAHVVKPLVSADWWEKTLDLLGKVAAEVPVYRLRFDKSGKVVPVLQEFLAETAPGEKSR